MRYETSLAQLNIDRSAAIPPGFVESQATVLVWDNIDFGRKLPRSGHGTTHHTNGIMVQSRVSEPQRLQERASLSQLRHTRF